MINDFTLLGAVSLAYNHWCRLQNLRDPTFRNQSFQICPHIPLPGTQTALFGLPKALLGHLAILTSTFHPPLLLSFATGLSIIEDGWKTLVESGSGSNETTKQQSSLLTRSYSATGRSVRSLIGLSEELATRPRVSLSLGITKVRAKLISVLPLSSLESSKIPWVPVLSSNPFSNLASIICQFRVPLVYRHAGDDIPGVNLQYPIGSSVFLLQKFRCRGEFDIESAEKSLTDVLNYERDPAS